METRLSMAAWKFKEMRQGGGIAQLQWIMRESDRANCAHNQNSQYKSVAVRLIV